MSVEIDAAIRETITSAADGAGIDLLMKSLGNSASRRTLLRRLDGMVANGVIERRGRARATRYHATSATPTAKRDDDRMILREDPPKTNAPPDSTATPRSGPQLSAEARKLRDIIRQQQAFRKPVGYRREFLEKYVPNKTAYLPEPMRAHLHAVGQSAHMAAMAPGTYARQLLDRLIIDLAWNSSRLEGNTFSLLETDHLIAQGAGEDPVRAREAQMILNHKAAIEFLVENPNDLGFNRYTLFNLHAILAEGLLKNRAAEGALRLTPVGIGGTVFHPCNEPPVIEECFDLVLKKAGAIRDPLECALFLMVHLPYLQPFEDCNKRTSRLAANLPLIQKNMSPLSFVDVPVRDYTDGILAVYELNRVELLAEVFAWSYERSAGRYASLRKEMDDPDPIDLRYRFEIKDLVCDVVVRRLDKLAAAEAVRVWANKNVTASDRARFVESVEGRLLALREGSSARYRIRPSEFAAWWPAWKR